MVIFLLAVKPPPVIVITVFAGPLVGLMVKDCEVVMVAVSEKPLLSVALRV